MVLIIKKENTEIYFLAKLSAFGYGPPIRLINLLDDENLDALFIRRQLYGCIIDKLISKRIWHRERGHLPSDVTNTLHDWLVEWFTHSNAKTVFIEVGNEVFS